MRHHKAVEASVDWLTATTDGKGDSPVYFSRYSLVVGAVSVGLGER